MRSLVAALLIVALLFAFTSAFAAEHKYVGAKACGMCHKTDKQGKQLDIWSKSKHASAYTTLTGDEAKKIAEKKGLKKAANESPECLECHVVAAAPDPKEGIGCEACHGAGSDFKAMSTMKDKAKAIAAGLMEYKDEAAIEKHCKTCHNAKSPSYKDFNFKEAWAKIKHPKPA